MAYSPVAVGQCGQPVPYIRYQRMDDAFECTEALLHKGRGSGNPLIPVFPHMAAYDTTGYNLEEKSGRYNIVEVRKNAKFAEIRIS